MGHTLTLHAVHFFLSSLTRVAHFQVVVRERFDIGKILSLSIRLENYEGHIMFVRNPRGLIFNCFVWREGLYFSLSLEIIALV